MKNITDVVRALISLLTVLFGFTFFFLAAFVYDVRDPQITICVVGLMGTVFGFWIGSSLGSSKKQETLDSIQKNTYGDIGGSNPPPTDPKDK